MSIRSDVDDRLSGRRAARRRSSAAVVVMALLMTAGVLVACSGGARTGPPGDPDVVLEDFAAVMRPQVDSMMAAIPTQEIRPTSDYRLSCRDRGGWPLKYDYALAATTTDRADARPYISAITERLEDEGWKIRYSDLFGPEHVHNVAQKDGFVLILDGFAEGAAGIDLNSPCVHEDGRVDRRPLS